MTTSHVQPLAPDTIVVKRHHRLEITQIAACNHRRKLIPDLESWLLVVGAVRHITVVSRYRAGKNESKQCMQ